MTNQWAHRTILVTGASRGIGLTVSHYFAQLGATVIGTAQSERSIDKIKEQASESGLGNIIPTLLQLDKKESIKALAAFLKQSSLEVDTLINNAGITDDQLGLRMSEASWDNVIQTNLSGTFFLTQSVLKGMLQKRFGRIISLSSVVAATGNPGQVNYCASKAGLIGMSKALALELASRQITVNVIAPGFIQTEMTQVLGEERQQNFLKKIPAGRFGTTDDIAHACVFLASEHSSYITGQVLHINGGLHCSH
jgi:3-oxoacyl-[acyl-carrier protein] reductase